jgi:hypothetical protein
VDPVTTYPSRGPVDDRFIAAVDLLGRTGAGEFQIRYCEEEEPVVWIAAAKWGDVWQSAGGMTPWLAVWRLAESVLDGGECRHCGRITSVDDNPPDSLLGVMGEVVCFYRYDPELKTFRRSCEGAA